MDDYYYVEDKPGSEDLLPLVCFRLGDEQYALDMARVHEVLRLVPITRVPQMPDFVLGAVNVRGNIIPVLDLRRKFALAERSLNEKAKLIVIDTRETPICFVADELLDNIKVERSSIAPAPGGKFKIPKECVAGISRLDERVIIILDWDKIYELAQKEISGFVS